MNRCCIVDLTWFPNKEYQIIVVRNTAVSYAKETTMLLSGHISTPAKYYTCTSIRFYLSFSERNHEWLVFRHSLTHRWFRRSRRKCNPPTMWFSRCLVELELKYTSKTPNTVSYIRRMRSIDFSELRALRINYLWRSVRHSSPTCWWNFTLGHKNLFLQLATKFQC